MMRFSANLGLLWTNLQLPAAIRAAKDNGFDAVECHWPYDVPPENVLQALNETGLRMLGLNTGRGDVSKGEIGVAALQGREYQSRQFIDEALAYAVKIGCDYIHVMAGTADFHNQIAQRVFTENIRYACRAAALVEKTVLIEPLNTYDAPGYFLSTLEDALLVIKQVGEPNLKIMFDCYHQQLMGGDLLNRFKHALPHIGHVQFASVPERVEPDIGEVYYPWLLKEFVVAGYTGMFGAEYKARARTEDGLSWLSDYRQ